MQSDDIEQWRANVVLVNLVIGEGASGNVSINALGTCPVPGCICLASAVIDVSIVVAPNDAPSVDLVHLLAMTRLAHSHTRVQSGIFPHFTFIIAQSPLSDLAPSVETMCPRTRRLSSSITVVSWEPCPYWSPRFQLPWLKSVITFNCREFSTADNCQMATCHWRLLSTVCVFKELQWGHLAPFLEATMAGNEEKCKNGKGK